MEYRNPGKITFEARIVGEPASGGAYVVFPFDVGPMFGTRARIPVRATFDGVLYRGSMNNMGTGNHVLIVVKDIRQRIGKEAGDTVQVSLELDTEPRMVDIPADFSALLNQNPDSGREFNRLSQSHRRDYILWINGAKRPQTREARMNKAIGLLAEGKALK